MKCIWLTKLNVLSPLCVHYEWCDDRYQRAIVSTRNMTINVMRLLYCVRSSYHNSVLQNKIISIESIPRNKKEKFIWKMLILKATFHTIEKLIELKKNNFLLRHWNWTWLHRCIYWLLYHFLIFLLRDRSN